MNQTLTMSDMHDLKEYFEVRDHAIHIDIVVKWKNLFSHTFEDEESLFICKTLFNDKCDQKIHSLAIS